MADESLLMEARLVDNVSPGFDAMAQHAQGFAQKAAQASSQSTSATNKNTEAVVALGKSHDTMADHIKGAGKEADKTQKHIHGIGEEGFSIHALSEHFELVNGKLKTFTNLAHFAGLAVLEIAGVEFIKEQAHEFAEWGESISIAAAKTGLSTDALQEWDFAAKTNAMTLDTLLPGFKNLAKNSVIAAEGNNALTQTFAKYKVELKDVNNHLRSTTDISNDFIDALAGITDKAIQNRIAMEVLGKSGQAFLPILANGAAGLKKAKEEAHELGLVFSGEAVEKAALLNEEMDKLGLVTRALKFEAVLAFVPPLAEAIGALTSTLVANKEIWKSTDVIMGETTEGLGIFGTVVMSVVGTVEIFSAMLFQAKTGYQELVELISTSGAAAIETVSIAWDELGIIIQSTAKTAELAWKALSHPSQAKQAIEEIGHVWEDTRKKISALDKEHDRQEAFYWDSFRDGVASHTKDLENSAEAVDKSLKSIRKSLSEKQEAKKKSEGGEGSEELDAAKQRKTELLALEKELSNERIRIKMAGLNDGFAKARALEEAEYQRRLTAFKGDNEKLALEYKIHTATMSAIKAEETAKDAKETLAAQQALQDVRISTLQDQDIREQLSLADKYSQKLLLVKDNEAAMSAIIEAYGMEGQELLDRQEMARTNTAISGGQARIKVKEAEMRSEVSMLTTIDGLVQAALGKSKAAFLIDKAIAAAKISINTAIAMSQAATLGPILGVPAVIWAESMGAIELATVAATTIKGYQAGGLPPEKNMLIRVNEDGRQEAVLNSRATASLGRDSINQLNQTGNLPTQQSQKPQLNITFHGSTYHVASEVSQNSILQVQNMEQSERNKTLQQLKQLLREADYIHA